MRGPELNVQNEADRAYFRMPDVAERLELQAQACAAMGSPFTARLMEAALSDYREGGPVRNLLDAHPEYHRPGLNLAGALHYLALHGEPTLSSHYPSVGGDGDASRAWYASRAILAQDPDRIVHLFRGIVQTNEPARSTPILAAALCVASQFGLPIRIFEIGASAALNLLFDRYRYEAVGWHWGDIRSPVVLRNRIETGRPKNLRAPLQVVERRGCDIHPIDLNDEDAALRLQSFVWPDQPERLKRLRAAIELAKAAPVVVDAESFSTWLPREVRCRAGYATVILHTVIEEHMSANERAELDGAVMATSQQASSRAPLARVRMELKGGTYRTEVITWSASSAATTICTSDGHAQGIVWL
jgi:hypothetical protein